MHRVESKGGDEKAPELSDSGQFEDGVNISINTFHIGPLIMVVPGNLRALRDGVIECKTTMP